MKKTNGLKKGLSMTELKSEGKKITNELNEKKELAKKYEHDKQALVEFKNMIENDTELTASEKKVQLKLVAQKMERLQKEITVNVNERVERLSDEAKTVMDEMVKKEKAIAELEKKAAEIKMDASVENASDILTELAKQKAEFEKTRNDLASDLKLRVQQIHAIKNGTYHTKE